MDSYVPLLERTRVPQPSLQKLAVISIFDKLRSSPPHLNSESDSGRDAVTQCLRSTSAAVVDQSVREICRLVNDSKLDLHRGLLELQAALEGSGPRFVDVFVKGLGFLVRLGFQNHSSTFRFSSSLSHPFVKILSCRTEVQLELVQQVLLFMVQNKKLGMVEVCEFLRPFLNYSILRIPYSTSLSLFTRNLILSMASLCCQYPSEAMPVFKLLIGCLSYFPRKNAEDSSAVTYIAEYILDAVIVVLRHLVGTKLLVHEAQLCGVELLETILSLHICISRRSGGGDATLEIARRLFVVQQELSLSYIHEVSSVMLSLLVTLFQSELEHEQLSILKLLLLLLTWKSETDCILCPIQDVRHVLFDPLALVSRAGMLPWEHVGGKAADSLNEELLFVFPAINLLSSPSDSVKQAATDVLYILGRLSTNMFIKPKKEMMHGRSPSVSTPGCIISRMLKHMWFQAFYDDYMLNVTSEDQSSFSNSLYLYHARIRETGYEGMNKLSKTSISLLCDYSLGLVERRKSSLPISQSQDMFLTEMPSLVGAIASVLVMHQKFGSSAIDLLAVTGSMDARLGVSLLLVILFYSNILYGKGEVIDLHDMLLKLLGVLPSLVSHPAMIPLVVQTILPMLQKDAKPVLYATATRLLCKTWEINDRVFGSLQAVLRPKRFTEFASESNICLSMAVSIRDVCRRNPDRGVDLILSVSACIESQDPTIQALGFQSLAHLCEADVVDFYTAWSVVAKHVANYLENPVLAHGICLLLRWGAMDAEAYPDAAMSVLQILLEVGSFRHPGHGSIWAKARASAIESLTQYEVLHIQKSILDFKERNLELFIHENNPEVLRAMEGFLVKIMAHEHTTRRRLVKDKRVGGNKIEKLLDVFPRAIMAAGNNSITRELPGAALFCLPLTPKDMNQGMSRVLQDIHARYENTLVEIAASLQLSRNILIALISLQSWKSFMHRWMRACIASVDAKAPHAKLDRSSNIATDILRSMRRIAEDSIPRSAENIALAVGALCMVLPSSAHAAKSTASKFLLNWLFQYEHEHRQWSAAISLGVITTGLHVTDHKQKFENINALLEVAAGSKSFLVKGACGVGLGFSCEDLLTRFEVDDHSHLDKDKYLIQESELLGKIVRTLIKMICEVSQSSDDALQTISAYFPLETDDIRSNIRSKLFSKKCDGLEEDIWGVAGLVLGLGYSVSAIYRSGAHDIVLKIKALVLSWIPHVNRSVESSIISEKGEMMLSVGSCLTLPVVVAFCQKVELIDDTDLDHIFSGCRELISELLSVKSSGTLYESLLMASCIGSGSLLACILNEGAHSLKIEYVKDLLALFRRSYCSPHHPLVHLGGMLGVVNALGAGAGTLFQHSPPTSSQMAYDQKPESLYIMGPLISSAAMEPDLTSSIQEMFLVAQNSADHQLQHLAAWTISFLRHRLCFRERQYEDSNIQGETGGSKSISQGFSQDSMVMKLCLWLLHLNHLETGSIAHVNTVTTALRCLSHAPRLPLLDWGAIIRRCMRYEVQVAELLPPDSTFTKGVLRAECLQFSINHADKFEPLLAFLDELSDLPRFRTLELNLQSSMLFHLADLMEIFSGSRLEKLFDDVTNFTYALVSSDQTYNSEEKSSLRVSCWKGLCMCLDEASLNSQEYISNVEKCMEALFSTLPDLSSEAILEVDQGYVMEEWSEAVRCLGKARQDWLLVLLQVFEVEFTNEESLVLEVKKKIQAKARLVNIGSIPLSELGKLKAYMLNSRSQAIWDVLVDVAATLQYAEGSAKRQWLVDTVEISCVTSYPSTALRFLGLLSGSFSKYMPLLIAEQTVVLSDLPVTLASLLSDTSWETVAESVVLHLWTSMERIHAWITHRGREEDYSNAQSIDRSEDDTAVMHHACVSLKDFLPLEKQLMLANMILPSVCISEGKLYPDRLSW
ncbi:hypothetical protein RJ639_036298 [Escallonia herrerae]|uniref:DUF3730 domain-containing protein n=1 Tax=Escallonia herrerae TaxID=1293975 RepID=A0AA89B708_9ASTE|nr:hypothetical protein RJ639_036298 [Escallonia herrerae]